MAIQVDDVIVDIKELLNDPDGDIYPTDRLLPLLNKAYRELQRKLRNNGIGTTSEVSAVIPVAAGTVELGDGSGLPSAFLQPLDLFERAQGSTENWQEMYERDWEPETPQESSLRVWAYREDVVKFVGATTARDVKMRYLKGLEALVGGGTIPVLDCQDWLASRTGAIAALVIGENETRAAALNADAETMIHDILSTRTRARQDMPLRRRPNRFRRS